MTYIASVHRIENHGFDHTLQRTVLQSIKRIDETLLNFELLTLNFELHGSTSSLTTFAHVIPATRAGPAAPNRAASAG